MENEVLEKVKNEYRSISKAISTNFVEINRLENNPAVRRYNYLKNIQKQYEYGELRGNREIIDYCLEKYAYDHIRQTNGIWLLLFECTVEKFERMTTAMLFEDNKDRIVAYYVDIEDSSKANTVFKEDQEEFERTHKVITGKNSILDCYDKYYNARREFFTTCLEEGQEKAVEMILSKYPKK